ncbi:hypothetical protein [Paraclostridium bifermentans]|uniref:hypothetical protein n=1 Tax=Paraclostridium bifermentans TaxID=1490 RepID=UPI00359C94F1
MKSRNSKEKGIIILACTMTVVIVLGFTLMQGTVKSKDNKYVSKQINKSTNINISKNDYEILDSKQDDKKQTLVILEKRKFTPEEIAALTNQVIKDKNNFEIYLFDNKEKVENFEYEEKQIQTLVQPSEKNQINIQNYYTVEEETESVPQYYAVESIKEEEGKTKIEISIEDATNPEKALAQIKFLGQEIKELNPKKELNDLEIITYYKGDEGPNWKYTSENKQLIIHNELVQL